MKLVKGVLLSEEDNEIVAVTLGEANKKFNGMLRMNGTAGFVVRQLERDTTEAEIVAALRNEYDVDEERATENVRSLLEKLRSIGLLEE